MSLGLDTASSEFFRNWYQTTDLGHYLDNFNDYTVYETETTGEWNIGNRNVFSIAGNSFKQSKYWLNGMRIDSRTMAGHTLLHTQMDRTSLLLDYHDGELFFTEDSVQKSAIRLTGNVGNLGGISPGTRQMINLFHTSGEERTMDKRPVDMRNHIVGGGTMEATFGIPAYGRTYYQHAYAHYDQRRLTAFDPTGISGMFPADNYQAQLDGEIPLNSKLSTLNYFLVAQGRSDYGSEFYFNRNELAKQQAYQAGLYSTTTFDNKGILVAGLSYELNQLNMLTVVCIVSTSPCSTISRSCRGCESMRKAITRSCISTRQRLPGRTPSIRNRSRTLHLRRSIRPLGRRKPSLPVSWRTRPWRSANGNRRKGSTSMLISASRWMVSC